MSAIVPTTPVPSQQVSIVLGGQPCQIMIGQKDTGLFVDLYVNNALIIGGVIAENANRIVRSAYLGFIGDLAFFDTQEASDPEYTGLGTRYQLVYLDA